MIYLMIVLPFGIDELVVSFVPLADIMHVRVNRRFAELAVQCAEHALCRVKSLDVPTMIRLLKLRELCPYIMSIDNAAIHMTIASDVRYEYCMQYASGSAIDAIVGFAAKCNNVYIFKKYVGNVLNSDLTYLYTRPYAYCMPKLLFFRLDYYSNSLNHACRTHDLGAAKKCIKEFRVPRGIYHQVIAAIATACNVFGEAIMVKTIVKYHGGNAAAMLVGYTFKNIGMLRCVLAQGDMDVRHAYKFINRNYEMVTKMIAARECSDMLVWQYILCARSDDDVRVAIGDGTYQIPGCVRYPDIGIAKIARCMRDKN